MKFGIEKLGGKGNSTNAKEVAKAEQLKRERESAVIRSADYKAQQAAIQAPFNNTFKKGPQKSAKDYKREKPQRGKDW